MFHFFEAIQNKSGDALPGYLVKLFDASGNLVPLYSDNAGTPIVNVSAIADTAVVDANGNVSLFVDYGTYDIGIYSPSGSQIQVVNDVPMGGITITLANGAAVSDRTALAGVLTPVAGQLASLTESGREGTFVFDSSNFVTKFGAPLTTIDPAQGIYVAPSTDTTGASGAWVRKFSGPIEGDWFGPDGVEDGTAINAAIALSGTIGKPRVRLSPKTYNTAINIPLNVAGLTLDLNGATINSTVATNTPALSFAADGAALRNGRLYMTNALPFLNVASTNWVLDNVVIEKPEGSPNIPLYIRAGSDGGRMVGCTLKGSNGIGVAESNNIAIIGNKFIARATGGDDAIAIKAITGSSIGWRIIGNYFENHAAFVSLGSEIGGNGVNDPTYSHVVSDIVVLGNTGKNCVSILYIKPGQIQDYRDGGVHSVVCSNNILRDPSGTKMEHIINITPGRGAFVENIKGTNNVAEGRTNWTAGAAVGYRIYIQDDTGVGTAATRINDIDVGLTLYDPYKGVAAGGAAPGSPFAEAADIGRANTAYGSISDVTVDVDCNGTSGAGINVGGSLDDVVYVRRAKLANINTSGTTIFGGITTTSRLTVSADVSIAMASGQPYYFPTAGSGDVRCPTLARQVYFGTFGAAAGLDAAAWTAPQRCVLMAVDMLTSNTLVADAANQAKVALANMEFANTQFAAWISSTAAGDGSNKRSGTTANVVTSVYRRRDVTLVADQAQALFARDGRLRLTKSNNGTGGATNDTRFEIRCAPY